MVIFGNSEVVVCLCTSGLLSVHSRMTPTRTRCLTLSIIILLHLVLRHLILSYLLLSYVILFHLIVYFILFYLVFCEDISYVLSYLSMYRKVALAAI